MWYASGRLTNPTLNQVLVDTGALPANKRLFKVDAGANVNAAFEIQHVAADGTTVLKSQIIATTGFGTASLGPQLSEIEMATNERIRVIMVAAVTGAVSVSIDITV